MENFNVSKRFYQEVIIPTAMTSGRANPNSISKYPQSRVFDHFKTAIGRLELPLDLVGITNDFIYFECDEMISNEDFNYSEYQSYLSYVREKFEQEIGTDRNVYFRKHQSESRKVIDEIKSVLDLSEEDLELLNTRLLDCISYSLKYVLDCEIESEGDSDFIKIINLLLMWQLRENDVYGHKIKLFPKHENYLLKLLTNDDEELLEVDLEEYLYEHRTKNGFIFDIVRLAECLINYEIKPLVNRNRAKSARARAIK